MEKIKQLFPLRKCCCCIRLRNGVFIIGGFQMLSACYQIYECVIILQGTQEKNVRMRNVLFDVSRTSIAFHVINIFLSFGLCVVSASLFKGARNFLVAWCIWVLIASMFLFGKIIILARIVQHPLRLYLKVSINIIFVILNAYFLAVSLSYIRYLDGYVHPKHHRPSKEQASPQYSCKHRGGPSDHEESDVCHLVNGESSEASTQCEKPANMCANSLESSFSQHYNCKLSPVQDSHLPCPPPPNPSFKDEYIKENLK